MAMPTDIEIALAAKMEPINLVGKKLGIGEEDLEPYGRFKAKVSEDFIRSLDSKPDGKLILVTAVNPTPAGEGKTTISVGLAQGLCALGKKAVLALREPSLGPVFGIKGGAAGGGYAQVVPMEDINLHFTGDMHAITAANNLLCAVIDNHMQQGNTLNIDPRQILFKRCMDMNDRALRDVIIGLGGRINGVPREDGFQITVASEVMAILCLAKDLEDLKICLGRILVARSYQGEALYAKDLGCVGAMAALLKDALKPNLVQTLENTPAIIHGGPFANIAHGCNSVRATRLALKLGDMAVTEAGFGSDLGAEKFFDIKCRKEGFKPACTVLVATVRALKYNGGLQKAELTAENLPALEKGLSNLEAHVTNLKKFGVPVVVAINPFPTDTENEFNLIKECCKKLSVPVAEAPVFTGGGEGGKVLAETVLEVLEKNSSDFKPLYSLDLTLEEKINTLAREIYGADGVNYVGAALKQLKEIKALGGDSLPICVAKTQYSLSDDPNKLGRPTGFSLTVKELKLSAGAGFVVVYTGDIMTMPGLPKNPAALAIDVDAEGRISGLF